MNIFFASGLFDSPWVIAVIIVGGAVINWLTQRRQRKEEQKQQEPPQAGGPSPGAPPKAEREFDMEETLRRLLGEEIVPPRPAEPPPVAPVAPPRPAPASPRPTIAPPPIRPRILEAPPASALVPPMPTARPPASILPKTASVEAAWQLETMALERESQPEPVLQTTVIAAPMPLRRSRGMRPGWNWRRRRSARQAFVASVVFSPPKGFEP